MANVVINGVTYSDVPSIQIPLAGSSGDAVFYDTSGASAGQGHILTGKSAYIGSGLVNGSMANNGNTSGTISAVAGTVSIPEGYTSGGTVQISSTEQAKIISANILSGVTMLGVSGASNNKDTTIASDYASASTILNGKKAYVNGSLVTGNMSVPTVSQNATTKVLTIS